MVKIKKTKLFFDGAFGTYYHKLTHNTDKCELANLNDRDTVYRIHREYLDAGVNAIKTNTFGANFLLHDDFSFVKDVIINGYEIAQNAVEGTGALVFADIGYINPEEESENISDEYIRIAQVFIECGAKNYLFETLAEYEVLLPVLAYIKEKVPDAFIIVSFAASSDGYTKKGLYYEHLIGEASSNPYVGAVGLNCICGPAHLYDLIKKLDLSGINFSAMPNSGYPSTINGRTVFQDNAEYFALRLSEIYAFGVRIIGGCCGTTPEHIRLAIKRIEDKGQVSFISIANKKTFSGKVTTVNSFKDKLESGKKVIAVEIDPPMDTDTEYLFSASARAKSAGADIITLADSPLARSRADSIVLAAKIKRDLDVEVIPHMSCRDKNYIAIKGSLLAANIENINNILIVTGDPVAQTDRGSYKGVFNFNSRNLMAFIKSLNEEVFQSAPFYIAGALNVNSLNFSHELKSAEKKVAGGAKVLFTQPLFSKDSIENLKEARERLDCKIMAGILPIASYKNALFLNNEVSGIRIPENVLSLLKDKKPDDALKVSYDYSMRTVREVTDFCDGYYLMTPLKKIDLVVSLIEEIRRLYK